MFVERLCLAIRFQHFRKINVVHWVTDFVEVNNFIVRSTSHQPDQRNGIRDSVFFLYSRAMSGRKATGYYPPHLSNSVP